MGDHQWRNSPREARGSLTNPQWEPFRAHDDWACGVSVGKQKNCTEGLLARACPGGHYSKLHETPGAIRLWSLEPVNASIWPKMGRS